uniref:Photosystem I reaction center subunit XII n=1 Tax=Euglena viridis TaxID=3040 RepID=PSAM_EUGVI|nr:RecName: Full=Photosystem I reaction center subunit XII; AltName: Full=PSI-M [Euglena viridis]AAF82464.1 photosystem I protein M [Euglena viridis]ABB02369.1 photosystem I protein M [Euglena viridis]
MTITSTQVYIALLTALIPAFFALKLGKELSK